MAVKTKDLVASHLRVLELASISETETKALRAAVSALAFYADEKNWDQDDWGVLSVVQPPEYGVPGKKARYALKRIDKILASIAESTLKDRND